MVNLQFRVFSMAFINKLIRCGPNCTHTSQEKKHWEQIVKKIVKELSKYTSIMPQYILLYTVCNYVLINNNTTNYIDLTLNALHYVALGKH